MKEYSNYHLSFNDKMVQDGQKMFQLAKKGVDGFSVLIDGETCEIVIQSKYTSLDGNAKNIMTDLNAFSLGSTIDYDSGKWLATALLKDNPVYQSGVMELCNTTLKWMGNEVYEFPCIVSARLLSENQTQNISLPDGDIIVTVPLNNNTKLIQLNQRFIFGTTVYSIKGIDDFSKRGLLLLSMRLDTKNSKDNFITRIADNSYFVNGGKWL